MAWELDPAVNEMITAAIKQGHRITACSSCGGPQIWSLAKPKSRCFRCNRYQEGESLPLKYKPTCVGCDRLFTKLFRPVNDKKGPKSKYCRKCWGLLKAEEAQARGVANRQESLQKGSETDAI